MWISWNYAIYRWKQCHTVNGICNKIGKCPNLAFKRHFQYMNVDMILELF